MAITKTHITVDKTQVAVDETVTVSGVVEGDIAAGQSVEVMLYVNDEDVDYLFLYPSPGHFEQEYKFYITFHEPGTYKIYTDAIIVSMVRPR